MRLTDNRVSTFLFVTEGVGVIFVGIFLVAYLGGLPSTNVLHSEPAFRIQLTILGIVLLVLVLVTIILAFFVKRSNRHS